MLGLEDWNNGILDKGASPLVPFKVLNIIIPGWNKQNGWLGIPCYQLFV
jgi:hypothetical protein